MIGKGKSYGAISVMNAIPCGIGSTIGIELITQSTYEEGKGNKQVITPVYSSEAEALVRICVSRAYRHMGKPEPEHWKIELDSQIPMSKGLKSSSSVCNAVVSSVFDANDFNCDKMTIIKVGVDCAREAGVTITGAFDDACGCHLGGLVVTNNANDELLIHKDIREMDVVIYIPEGTVSNKGLGIEGLKAIETEMKELSSIIETDPFKVMIENGKLVSNALGLDNSISDEALKSGALAAGLSGTGPAIAMLFEKGTYKTFTDSVNDSHIVITKTRGLSD